MTAQPGSTEFSEALSRELVGLGLNPLSEEQSDLLYLHFELLSKWNRALNLTRITGLHEAVRLQYAESLFAATLTGDAGNLLDIGSGAGFPAIPFAVARPTLNVTALEANQKKAVFLEEAKESLSLSNLTVVRSRLEEFDWSGFELLACKALDQPERALPPVIESLAPAQRLFLFSTDDSLRRIETRLSKKPAIKLHPIPGSRSRQIAIFSGDT